MEVLLTAVCTGDVLPVGAHQHNVEFRGHKSAVGFAIVAVTCQAVSLLNRTYRKNFQRCVDALFELKREKFVLNVAKIADEA